MPRPPATEVKLPSGSAAHKSFMSLLFDNLGVADRLKSTNYATRTISASEFHRGVAQPIVDVSHATTRPVDAVRR
ncbi:hypothetical protein FAIPA1_340002 [Frankia sp. AiPs1]